MQVKENLSKGGELWNLDHNLYVTSTEGLFGHMIYMFVSLTILYVLKSTVVFSEFIENLYRIESIYSITLFNKHLSNLNTITKMQNITYLNLNSSTKSIITFPLV